MLKTRCCLIARVFRDGALVFTATLPLDTTPEQLMLWVEELEKRGFGVEVQPHTSRPFDHAEG
jgi:hypothetical protein